MNADENQADLTERIIGAVFEVSNTLGSGFLEKVYERALLRELKLRGLAAVSQASFRVMYKGESVGEYFGDIVVEDAVVIELKCADQCLNYLRAPGKTLCLLVNFQKPIVEFKRVALSYQICRG